MKELQKEEKKNDNPGSSSKDKNETMQFFNEDIKRIVGIQTLFNTIGVIYLEQSTVEFKQPIFHPPLI